MASPSQAQLTALYAQHSLQSEDMKDIIQLANVAGLSEKVNTWSFEQFLGFTLHLFITSESPSTCIQVSHLLPKFGSAAVIPLVKIAHHFQSVEAASSHTKTLSHSKTLRALALNSLSKMSARALILGLKEVLTLKNSDELLPTVIRVLTRLIGREGSAVLLLLSQLLAPEDAQFLKQQLMDAPVSSAVLSSKARSAADAVSIPQAQYQQIAV